MPTRFIVTAVWVVLVALTAQAGAQANPYPASVYPSPVASKGQALSLCPSAAGLEPFDAAATSLARKAAGQYVRKSLGTDLRDSDRAWWPTVKRMWKSRTQDVAGRVVLGSEPAADNGYKVFLEPSCGSAIVRRSLIVTIGPDRSGPGPHCNACRSSLFFVDRGGRPLAYYLY